ncbi:hypothetical protein ARMGADRAFT_734795 [Armillaria gallica]|uniref:Uncharacterized protein n=1 Tax=Armillaria gallica TaxID=47427 RepID=A0A2H3CGX9_ARMGA|nr:hypothetical protein ARMGADRAFT_734795 [Armillaria gallica]
MYTSFKGRCHMKLSNTPARTMRILQCPGLLRMSLQDAQLSTCRGHEPLLRRTPIHIVSSVGLVLSIPSLKTPIQSPTSAQAEVLHSFRMHSHTCSMWAPYPSGTSRPFFTYAHAEALRAPQPSASNLHPQGASMVTHCGTSSKYRIRHQEEITCSWRERSQV